MGQLVVLGDSLSNNLHFETEEETMNHFGTSLNEGFVHTVLFGDVTHGRTGFRVWLVQEDGS